MPLLHRPVDCGVVRTRNAFADQGLAQPCRNLQTTEALVWCCLMGIFNQHHLPSTLLGCRSAIIGASPIPTGVARSCNEEWPKTSNWS